MARVVAQVKSELSSWLTSLGAGEVSRDFFELIKAIGEARSKQEEHTIIDQEAKALKLQLKQGQGVSQDDPRLIRELLVRLMYCEMLGIQVPFGYMVALNLMQMRARLIDKRVGYLAASLFLHPEHELVTLCINSWRRDLQSQSHVEQDMALVAMSQLLSPEGIPAVLPELLKCTAHLEASVRKKAVVVLHRVLQLEPSHALEREVADTLRRTLCDHEPSVMAATLNVYATLVQRALADEDTAQLESYRELVPSLVSILKQIIEHALARDFDYQHVPAPWLQVRLLALLASLGAGVRSSSEHAYSIVLETLRRAEQLPVNAARAVQYSAVTCIAQLFPNSALLDAAASAVTALLADKERNVRYLGLKALLALVSVNPAYALSHQRAVIECLSDPDETLQRVTLRLLHAMANPSNVAVVAERFLEHLRKSSDDYVRRDLVAKLTSIAEQFAPDNAWFISTLVKVFVLGGALVAPEVAYNLLVLIAEGSTGGEDEVADLALRKDAVQQILRIAQKPQVQARAAILSQVSAWLLGEYSYVIHAERDAVDVCVDLLEKTHEDEHVRVWFISALAKLTAQLGEATPAVQTALDKYAHSHNVELQQRACELKTLLASEKESRGILRTLLPVDASTRDAAVDPQLPFLDEWIRAQVSAGRVPARAYQSQSQSVLSRARINSSSAPKRALNYVYKAQSPATAVTKQATSIYESDSSSGTSESSVTSSITLPSSGATVWGAGGWANARSTGTVPAAGSSRSDSQQSTITSIPLSKPLGSQSLANAPSPQGTGGSTPSSSAASSSPASTAATSAPKSLASTATQPAVPTMSTADERFAQQLFGSFSASLHSGGGSARGRGGLAVSPATNRSAAIPAARQPTLSSSPTASSRQLVPEANLLDLSFASSSPAANAGNSSGGASLLDPMPAPLLLAEDGAWPQALGGDNYDASNLRLPSGVQSLLQSSSPQRILASSPELLVHARVCYLPDSTLLLLCVSNRHDGGLSDITLNITSHQALTLSLLSSDNALGRSLQHVSTAVSSSNAHAVRITTRALPSRCTVALLISLIAREPISHAQLALTTAGSFNHAASELRVLHVRGTVTLSTLDWIRPRSLDLSTYGKQWPLHTREQKFTLTIPLSSAEELSHWIPSHWHFHVVSLKGTEIVAAAVALHGSLSSEHSSVLLYVKVGAQSSSSQLSVSVSVRGLDARVAETVASAIRTRV